MQHIVAFAGRKQSGKTTACEYVQEIFTNSVQKNSAIYNFADPLKQLCIDILGFTYDQCYGSDNSKNEYVNCLWPDSGKPMKAREVMQYVGTNIFRKMQHNVWADATMRKIQDENLPLALIADCRFPNEVEAIKNAGGLVIKLNRNLYKSSHESEIALDEDQYDQSNFDFVIDNQNMNIEDKNKLIYDYLKVKRVLPL
jgi:hypothetical protein